jgi:hypothetical protein
MREEAPTLCVARGAAEGTGAGGTRRTCWKRKNRNVWLNHHVRKQGREVRVRRRCRGGGEGED